MAFILIIFRCLSDHSPPLFGEKSSICKGNKPQTSQELKIAGMAHTKGVWTIYLVVAIFVTMLLTIIATFAIMKFFCAGE